MKHGFGCRSRMEVMKLLLQLSEELQAAQGEKAGLREKVDDVDQAVAQILGEIQKTAAKCSHARSAAMSRLSLSSGHSGSHLRPKGMSYRHVESATLVVGPPHSFCL